MSYDPSQYLRQSVDSILALPNMIGAAQYQVYLVQVSKDQISFDDVSAARTVAKTRITVADGYRANAPQDGYLNPVLKHQSGEQLVLSNGQLTNNLIIMGPLVFPYATATMTGGLDPTLFQPATSNINIQTFIQIAGSGLSPKGNFFDIKEIILEVMSNITYSVLLSVNDRVVT